MKRQPRMLENASRAYYDFYSKSNQKRSRPKAPPGSACSNESSETTAEIEEDTANQTGC